ncbi:MAG: subclass B1 metallo-beta-lactamase [Chitinophagales bacterium]
MWANTLLQAQQPKLMAKAILLKNDDLEIRQLSPNTFQHISFIQTNDFGLVACNGLVVRDGTEAVVFDTPANDKASTLLIEWIERTLHCNIKAVVPTHFHEDCLGGLQTFHDHKIPSYASAKTRELAAMRHYMVPQNSFIDSLHLNVGSHYVAVQFFGEGHTRDNVVGYFPNDQVLFGGCLIKELGAGKGFLGDANVAEWSATVAKVKNAFPEVKIVVPGHGAAGNKKLLDYTIRMFK